MSGEAQTTVQAANNDSHPSPPSLVNHPAGDSSACTDSTPDLEPAPEMSQAMREIATLALIHVNQIQDLSDNACNGSHLHVRSHDKLCDIHAIVGEAIKDLRQGDKDTEQTISSLMALQTSFPGWLSKWEQDFEELHRQYRRTLPYRRACKITNPDGVTYAPAAYEDVIDTVLEDGGPELDHIGVVYFDGEPSVRNSPGRIRWAMYRRTLNENTN